MACPHGVRNEECIGALTDVFGPEACRRHSDVVGMPCSAVCLEDWLSVMVQILRNDIPGTGEQISSIFSMKMTEIGREVWKTEVDRMKSRSVMEDADAIHADLETTSIAGTSHHP